MNIRSLLPHLKSRMSTNQDQPEADQDAPQQRPVSFSSLPPVSHWIDTTPWIDMTDVQLQGPVEMYVERDLLPIPPTANREGYHHERHYDYWLSGLKDYLQIKERCQPLLPAFGQDTAVLDFGCASGRVLRHFNCQETGVTLWGCDLNFDHIRWNQKFLGANARIFPNMAYPALPLEDNSMTLVYAFSVFTHIDEYELAWLAELRRILQPGGIAYLTVHTDHTWQILGPTHALYHGLMWLKDQIEDYEISDQLFAKPMPDDRIAFRWSTNGNTQSNVFHSHAYLRAQWGKFFNVIELIPEGADYQDVIILQK